MHFCAASSSFSTHSTPFTFWHRKNSVSVIEDSNPQFFTEKKTYENYTSSMVYFYFYCSSKIVSFIQKQLHLYKKASLFISDVLPHAAAYCFSLVYPTLTWWYQTMLPYRSYQKSSFIQVSGSCNFQLYQECSSQFRTQRCTLVREFC